jgi:hypothetical protein
MRYDGNAIEELWLVFVLKTVSKKPETVSYGFSIHFSSGYWYNGLTVFQEPSRTGRCDH